MLVYVSCVVRLWGVCHVQPEHRRDTASVSVSYSLHHHHHADRACMQLVALYCSKVLGKRALALRVMKRIKIMEEELVRVCELSLFGFVVGGGWLCQGITSLYMHTTTGLGGGGRRGGMRNDGPSMPSARFRPRAKHGREV